MRLFTVLIGSVLLWSCGGKHRDDTKLLPKEKMQAVMWDILQANSYTQLFVRKDSILNPSVENMKLQQKIFEIHNVTRERFFNSYDYYATKPELMKGLIDSAIALGEREKIRMYEKRDTLPGKSR